MQVRSEKDLSATATMWQLQVFVAAVELEDWALVEQRLGVDRYRCRRALDRLGDRLGLDGLLPREQDRISVSPHERELAEMAKRVLSAYEELRAASTAINRNILLRFAAYPAQLKRFAAQAMGEIEREMPHVRIECQDLEGRRRRGGAPSAKLIREGILDIAIAPSTTEDSVPDDVIVRDLYQWNLVCVASPDNSIMHNNNRSRPGRINVAELEGRQILVSPKGHRSRDLLDLFANLNKPWYVVGESEDPELLASLALHSNRIAVIPDDSFATPLVEWPIVVSSAHGPLGGNYRVLWRDADPDPVRTEALEHFAQRLYECTASLRVKRPGSGPI
jgi:DNA-binding transcriptional LysR family regulator